MQSSLLFFSKNISVYAIFNGQSFNDMFTNDIISFEQLGPGSIQINMYRLFCGSFFYIIYIFLFGYNIGVQVYTIL